MNVLFVMYGDLAGNSAVPLGIYSREFASAGHHCAVAVTDDAPSPGAVFHGHVATHARALAQPEALFPDGRAADVVHAWTPRENVRRFVTAWMARFPAPLVMYLEDNEGWIAQQLLGVADARALLSLSDE